MNKILLGLVATGLVLALVWQVFAVCNSTDYNFNRTMTSVTGEVEFLFDEMAVPHSYAESEADTMYALGYVPAAYLVVRALCR